MAESNVKLILIGGRRGSGKDTMSRAISLLYRRDRCRIVRLAAPLKGIVLQNGCRVGAIIPQNDDVARYELICAGASAKSDIDLNIYVKMLVSYIRHFIAFHHLEDQQNVFIVPDLRFRHELQEFRREFGSENVFAIYLLKQFTTSPSDSSPMRELQKIIDSDKSENDLLGDLEAMNLVVDVTPDIPAPFADQNVYTTAFEKIFKALQQAVPVDYLPGEQKPRIYVAFPISRNIAPNNWNAWTERYTKICEELEMKYNFSVEQIDTSCDTRMVEYLANDSFKKWADKVVSGNNERLAVSDAAMFIWEKYSIGMMQELMLAQIFNLPVVSVVSSYSEPNLVVHPYIWWWSKNEVYETVDEAAQQLRSFFCQPTNWQNQ
jgi:hypothetical protein